MQKVFFYKCTKRFQRLFQNCGAINVFFQHCYSRQEKTNNPHFQAPFVLTLLEIGLFHLLKLTSLSNTSGVCVPCSVVAQIQAVLPDFKTFKHWQRHNWPRRWVLLLGIITVIVLVMICTMRQFHKSSVYEMCDFLHLRIHKVCTHPRHVTFNLRNPCQT